MHGRPRVYVRFRPPTEVKLPALKGPGIPASDTEVPVLLGRRRDQEEEPASRRISLEGEHTIKFPWKSQSKEEWKEVQVQVDHAFTEDSTQDAVYSRVGPEMLDFVLKGFRGLICTYGITGSGKSYTMLGEQGSSGLAQRLIEELFLRGLPDFSVSLQAIQLHQNDFTDLGLPEMPSLKDLKVQSGNGSENTGAQEFEFRSSDPALAWLSEVLGRRAKLKTRSHFLLRVNIRFTSGGAALSAVLDLADLAGCEKMDEGLDVAAKKNHMTIQAGLSNLRHCIEAKVKGKAVPFTYFSLPRLLAPDFRGDASISFVINCPSLSDVDRTAETSETLDLARFILRLELAYRAQKATVQLTAEELLKSAESRAERAPTPKAEAPVGPMPSDDREIRRLRKKLERRSQEVQELRKQLEAQRLGPLLKRSLEKASSEEVRELLKEVEQRYPEILQAWPRWREQLEKGDFQDQLLEVQKAVDQRELQLQSFQWLLQRKEELQNCEELPEEVRQLRQQQVAALDLLLDSAGLSNEQRADLAKEAAQKEALQQKLQKKQEEIGLLETNLHLAGARDDAPVKKELLEDLAAFGIDELKQAVERLPGSTSTLQHLLMAHPSWKQRFYQIGGLEKILEKMERTKKAFYHQRLAQCLCRTLDMEKVGRKDRSELLPRLVKQVLDITNGIRFPLDANSDENRILEYMDLMEAVAQDKEARCLLVRGDAVSKALQFTQHRAQAVAAAALNALGQVASDAMEEVSLPADALRWMLSLLRSGQSARLKKAAAQCLQRLCYGSSASAQALRRSLDQLQAVPELLAAARHFQSAEQQVGRNDGAEVARHVKNAALLMLNDRKITPEPDPSHGRIVLEAMAYATAKSFAKEIAFNNEAAGVQCFGHVKLGAWTAQPATAGGPLECSLSWMNPMFALRFPPGRKAAVAVAVIDPDAESRREHGPSQQRSLYHVSRIMTVKRAHSAEGAEEKDQAKFLEDLVDRGFNSPLFWQGLQSAAPFMSEDVTAQHVEELDTDDSHILMLSMGTALQEKRYVVSVCADAQLELVPLSTEGWQRRSFAGQWCSSIPGSAQAMIDLQQVFPQLILTNAATSPASVCFILSFTSKDAQHVNKHKWHEEDDEENLDASCPAASYPLLDIQLFETGKHPIQRYVGGGTAVAKNRKSSNEWVALGAQLPPCSTHSLVIGRCWGHTQKQLQDKAEFQSFRLLVLSDCELEMQPVRCSNEWRVASSKLLRVQDTKASKLKLQLKDGSSSESEASQPRHPVKIMVTTCADEESPAYMMLQAFPPDGKVEVEPVLCPSKNGKRLFLSPNVHNEYELSGGDWTISINYHPQCKPGFLLGVRVFSLCDLELQWQSPTEAPEKVDPSNDFERSFVEEFRTQLPSWQRPHSDEDLRIEDSAFPPVPKQRAEDKEMISVSMAYLQRLHRRALRDQGPTED